MVKYVNISVPKPLYERLQRTLEGTGYRSPTEYIVYLLRRFLSELESEDLDTRMEALGYK